MFGSTLVSHAPLEPVQLISDPETSTIRERDFTVSGHEVEKQRKYHKNIIRLATRRSCYCRKCKESEGKGKQETVQDRNHINRNGEKGRENEKKGTSGQTRNILINCL